MADTPTQIPCRDITFRPGGSQRRLAMMSFLFTFAGVLGGLEVLLENVSMLPAWIVGVLVISAPAALWRYRSQPRKGGTLSIAEGRLRLSGIPEAISLAQIVQAEPRGWHGLFLKTLDSTEIEVTTLELSPDKLLEALGYDPATRTVIAPFESFPSSSFVGIMTLLLGTPGASWVLFALTGSFGREHVGGVLLAAFLLACVTSLLLGRRLNARRVEISLKGVRVIRFSGERFLPRSKIERVEDIEEKSEEAPEPENDEAPLYNRSKRTVLRGFRVHPKKGAPLTLKGLPAAQILQIKSALARFRDG
jgi:hypothetical protein